MMRFLLEREEFGTSLVWYASKNGVPYYTARDWYRDARINPACFNRYDYMAGGSKYRDASDAPVCFVKIRDAESL